MADDDLIRRGDARRVMLAYASSYSAEQAETAIATLPAQGVSLPTNVRKWPFYPIQMPFTADGKGPATVGVDATDIAYEVWDHEFNSHASFDNLPDAINEAMRLSLAALAPAEAGGVDDKTRILHERPVRVCPICDIADCAAHRDTPAPVDALVKAAERMEVLSRSQMRTADYHGEGCNCYRCAQDALFAALAAIRGEKP